MCSILGYRIQDAGIRIQNTEYRIQDTEYRMQDTRYRIRTLFPEYSNFFHRKYFLGTSKILRAENLRTVDIEINA